MSEVLLMAVINVFALLAGLRGSRGRAAARQALERYLTGHVLLRDTDEYLQLFDEFLDFSQDQDVHQRSKTVWAICDQLRTRLPREEQYAALMNILELSAGPESGKAAGQESGDGTAEAIKTLEGVAASALDVDFDELIRIRLLLHSAGDHAALGPEFLVLDRGDGSPGQAETMACRRLKKPGFRAAFTVLALAETGSLCLAHTGLGLLSVNGRLLRPGQFMLLPAGAVLRDDQGGVIHHAELVSALCRSQLGMPLAFEGKDVDFRFPGSDNGLHHFSFSEASGHLVGVMGGSGAGKSTLLSILSGGLTPNSGQVLVGGRDLYRQGLEQEGVMGFVPQDDLLFEDLTVFQNLYYAARLCLAHLDDEALRQRVDNMLRELGQYETRDLKVGSPLEKTISGGQRKRLNIALELIREPGILFADEPTSGLSSADSVNVMSLLKEQAAKGRLVIVVIHQPSSQIFKMFDALWVLDKGGRPVFTGNPLDAVSWFRGQAMLAGAEDAVCASCGNVNPEQVFDIIEMRKVDERGRFTEERVISPQEWHRRHLERQEKERQAREQQEKGRADSPAGPSGPEAASCGGSTPDQDAPDPAAPDQATPETGAPPQSLWRPGFFGQAKVFFARTLLGRLANRQYLLVNLLEAPLIALVLALLCRYVPEGEYSFGANPNMGLFLFMAVIVAVFLGLSVSAEEIVRDRKVLKREQFLSLSWPAYISAKTGYLALLCGLQALTFLVVALPVLDVPGLWWRGWLTLFSCALCSSLVGLNISAAFRSVVAIYILVPLLVIPQMLLSGAVIDFGQMVGRDADQELVPLYADLMPARWGYEALLTAQYRTNAWMAPRLEDDCAMRAIDLDLDYRVEEVRSLADSVFLPEDLRAQAENVVAVDRALAIVLGEVRDMERISGLVSPLDSGLEDADFTPETFTRDKLDRLKEFLAAYGKLRRAERGEHYASLQAIDAEQLERLGPDGVEALRQDNYNKSLALIAQNRAGFKTTRLGASRVVPLSEAVCRPGTNPLGRAHFAAGAKRLGPWTLDTFWFDLGVLWLLSMLLFLALRLRLLERAMELRLFRKK